MQASIPVVTRSTLWEISAKRINKQYTFTLFGNFFNILHSEIYYRKLGVIGNEITCRGFMKNWNHE